MRPCKSKTAPIAASTDALSVTSIGCLAIPGAFEPRQRVGPVGRDHKISVAGEPRRDRAADPAGAARDDGDRASRSCRFPCPDHIAELDGLGEDVVEERVHIVLVRVFERDMSVEARGLQRRQLALRY